MAVLFSILVGAGLIALVRGFWNRCSSLPRTKLPSSFRAWLWRGVGVPLLVLLAFSLGPAPGIPPILYKVNGSAPNKPLAEAWAAYCLIALLIISWWAAVSLLWMVGAHLKRSRQSRKGSATLLMCGLLLGILPALGLGLVFGWLTLGFVSTIALLPLAQVILPHLSIRQNGPRYESVFQSLNEGKVAAAEWEILRQLEKFPEDFQGWLLLAEVYAEHYRDIDAARETVLATCAHKNITWAETAVALHRLADWHLEIARDVAGARRALDEIGRRMPGTHLAEDAQQRVDRLREAESDNRRLPVPRIAVEDPLNDKRTMSGPRLNQAVAGTRVTACLRCLERDPRDAAAREDLARLYAEHLGQSDRGIRELKLLLELPDQPAHKIMEWLGLLSQWQEHYRNDAAAARQALRRMVGQFPQSVQGFAALRKLTLTGLQAPNAKLQSPGNQ